MARSIVRMAMFAAICSACAANLAQGQHLSIYDIQYTESADGASPFANQIVDCAGGIVVAKFAGWRPRVILMDPSQPNGWGGIQIKDWTNGDLYNEVFLGDWVQVENVFVEEFRGTTMLQWQTAYAPTFSVLSNNNTIPPPLRVDVSSLPAPHYDATEDAWVVDDHRAEPYESMIIFIQGVRVTERDLGKELDNYNLEAEDGSACWAADYMNSEVGPWGYHPFVEIGQEFCAVAGLFEQYTMLSNGWDYYQLITQSTADLAICADGNRDGAVDLDDLLSFEVCATGPTRVGPTSSYEPSWISPPTALPFDQCLMMDIDFDGDVTLADFSAMQEILAE